MDPASPHEVPRDGTRPLNVIPRPRLGPPRVQEAIEIVAQSEVMSVLLENFSTMLAVLTEQRQVVAVNRRLLRHLGLEEPCLTGGPRPGDLLSCVFAAAAPDGCGSHQACTSCGAAIALATAEQGMDNVERECLLTLRRGQQLENWEFRVRAAPIRLDGGSFIVLSLEDIRDKKRREALERVFFHDVMNRVQGLTSRIELAAALGPEHAWSELPAMERQAARLVRELKAQRDFSLIERGDYQPRPEPVCLSEVTEVIEEAFSSYGLAQSRNLQIIAPPEDLILDIDRELLERVLENMVKNALEASPEGAEVRLECAVSPTAIRFRCWNPGFITEKVAPRIFQRFFSTKGGTGRGLGTYGMKLLGERYLGGRVWFTSSAEDGTSFFLELARG